MKPHPPGGFDVGDVTKTSCARETATGAGRYTGAMTNHASPRRTLVWLCFGLILSGCDRFYTVAGRVTDCATHRPIAGASVTVWLNEWDNDAVVADAEGRFHVALNDPPSQLVSTLTESAENYVTRTGRVSHQHEANQGLCLRASNERVTPAPHSSP